MLYKKTHMLNFCWGSWGREVKTIILIWDL